MTGKAPKRPRDANQLAKAIVDLATGAASEAEKDEASSAAAILGRMGGLKGGVARAKKLSPEERKRIAASAARARWGKKK